MISVFRSIVLLVMPLVINNNRYITGISPTLPRGRKYVSSLWKPYCERYTNFITGSNAITDARQASFSFAEIHSIAISQGRDRTPAAASRPLPRGDQSNEGTSEGYLSRAGTGGAVILQDERRGDADSERA
ncbi:hypothetical protein V491_09263 [Pseudogymnoascus sp. VKM F-3775]|nr:hypothetical protein V491_09263 [Pseudogymnoascus sp. VKM F-3775]